MHSIAKLKFFYSKASLPLYFQFKGEFSLYDFYFLFLIGDSDSYFKKFGSV
jgi:hypothetical protein